MSGAEGFSVSPDALAGHAAHFGEYADRAGGIGAELRRALAEAGECWGTDETGRAFARGHVPAADDALRSLSALPGELDDVGNRLRQTATAYQRVDEDNAAAMTGDRRQDR